MSTVIDTPEALDELQQNAGIVVVLTNEGPAIVWMGEDECWHSIRALNEDDGPQDYSALAISAGVDLDGDPDDVLPLTVLWRDDEEWRAERDEHHTMDELYEYRMLYNAHAAQGWLAAGIPVVKSHRHSDGEECFGGGWFIVSAALPTGQVSNHYRDEFWDLFAVPEVETAPEWDGHTPAIAAERLRDDLATHHPARVPPSVEDVARVVDPDAWEQRSGLDTEHALARSKRRIAALRAGVRLLALFDDLPTVQQVRAEALREAADDWEALVRQEKPPVRGSLWLMDRARAAETEGE